MSSIYVEASQPAVPQRASGTVAHHHYVLRGVEQIRQFIDHTGLHVHRPFPALCTQVWSCEKFVGQLLMHIMRDISGGRPVRLTGVGSDLDLQPHELRQNLRYFECLCLGA